MVGGGGCRGVERGKGALERGGELVMSLDDGCYVGVYYG